MKKYIAPKIKSLEICNDEILAASDRSSLSVGASGEVQSLDRQLAKPNSLWDELGDDGGKPQEE